MHRCMIIEVIKSKSRITYGPVYETSSGSCVRSVKSEHVRTLAYILTHIDSVTHFCVSDIGTYWFWWWLISSSTPNPYMTHCWCIGNSTIRKQWFSLAQIKMSLFRDIAFKYACVINICYKHCISVKECVPLIMKSSITWIRIMPHFCIIKKRFLDLTQLCWCKHR